MTSQSRPEHGSVATLVRLSRAVTTGGANDAILPLVTEAAMVHFQARGAAVVAVTPNGGVALEAAQGLPDGFAARLGEVDAFDPELEERVVQALGEPGTQARTFPLVSAGDLYGTLIVVLDAGRELDEEAHALLEGLADLGGTALARSAHDAELARSRRELRASRDLLERTHKLRALGEMAAGISHDLKNILNPLSLHLQFLKRAVPKEDVDSQQSIADMQHVLRRGLETIERLRAFSRQAPAGNPDLVDLPQLAKEALEICRPRLRVRHDKHVQLVGNTEPAPRVRMRASDGVAAVVNLLVNAIEAVEEQGGAVEITTGELDGGAFLRVRDDGPGMPPDVEARVFEPFFTTKGEEGTGLGLAMVYAFVQRSRGRLSLETAPGAGASFTLWFPATEA
jgi:signal transduction histidine kinase